MLGIVSDWSAALPGPQLGIAPVYDLNVMGKDARVEVPPPGESDQVKAEVYRIRGETVSIGGSVEWVIGTFARKFAASTQMETGRLWEDLKGYISQEGLNSRLQPELAAVAGFFTPRNLATHGAIIIAQVGQTSQIFRLYHDSGEPQAGIVTLEELRAESAAARAGYEAIHAIGRELDDNDPAVLVGTNVIMRAMLLDR